MKDKMFTVVLVVVIISMLLFIYLITGKDDKESHTSILYEHDISTKEKAIGVSDYVFVIKVNNKLNKKIIDKETYNVYDAFVVESIKGEVINNIKLLQVTGINSKDLAKPIKKDNYYLVLANALNEGGELEASLKEKVILLSGISDPKIDEYKKAYKKEVVPKGYKKVISKYDVHYQS